VRIRVAGRTDSMREAMRIANEVESLYTCGPAGGGGAFKSARDIVAVLSTLLPREKVWPRPLGGEADMLLRDIAHARAGDKGNISNISVIAYDPAGLSAAGALAHRRARRAHLRYRRGHGEVLRYALPALGALNFVLHDALAGGVTRSLALDAHGKTLSSALLSLDMPEDDSRNGPYPAGTAK
jgi:hypothetical protein